MSVFISEGIRALPHDVSSLPAWVRPFSAPPSHLVSTYFDAPGDMARAAFESAVTAAYRSVFDELDRQPSLRPVRFWAFLPGIHRDLGDDIDRYKAFNAARYGAFLAHFGSSRFLGGSIPTASAVGGDGARFQLHCLATTEPGIPVENPRQVPAYQYSRRFGPLPPSFARATLLKASSDAPLLLVGGTASIVGEDSQHAGDFERQANETLLNLATLVASAQGTPLPAAGDDLRPLLGRYDDLRIYCPQPDAAETLGRLVEAHFAATCHVEVVRASLCRAELLIEIEGTARPARGRR